MPSEYDLVALKMNLAKWPRLLDKIPYEIPNAEELLATDRGVVLFATVHRAATLCRAICLMADASFSQEASCLSRSLAELVINGIYLQFCDEQEVIRFKNFDVLSKRKNLEGFLRLVGQSQREEVVLDSNFALVEDIVAVANDAIGQNLSQTRWSARDVASRAAFVDYHLHNRSMRTVVAVAYQPAHSSVHSTWSSFPSAGEDKSGDYINAVLLGVDLSLKALASFVSAKYLNQTQGC